MINLDTLQNSNCNLTQFWIEKKINNCATVSKNSSKGKSKSKPKK